METTKTTEKFQSVHKTFSYTPKSALTNQWSSLAFGIGMVINPEKPDVPLNKNDAFQKVQKRRV